VFVIGLVGGGWSWKGGFDREGWGGEVESGVRMEGGRRGGVRFAAVNPVTGRASSRLIPPVRGTSRSTARGPTPRSRLDRTTPLGFVMVNVLRKMLGEPSSACGAAEPAPALVKPSVGGHSFCREGSSLKAVSDDRLEELRDAEGDDGPATGEWRLGPPKVRPAFFRSGAA